MNYRDQKIVDLASVVMALCSWDDAKLLQLRGYIRPHKRSQSVWIAIESAAEIKAQLRRKIPKVLPVAEDSRTVRRVNSKRGGVYYEHHEKHCEAFKRAA